MKSRSRLEILTRSRSRRLRPRLHHCYFAIRLCLLCDCSLVLLSPFPLAQLAKVAPLIGVLFMYFFKTFRVYIQGVCLSFGLGFTFMVQVNGLFFGFGFQIQLLGLSFRFEFWVQDFGLGFGFTFWVQVLGLGFGFRFWVQALGLGFGFRF